MNHLISLSSEYGDNTLSNARKKFPDALVVDCACISYDELHEIDMNKTIIFENMDSAPKYVLSYIISNIHPDLL